MSVSTLGKKFFIITHSVAVAMSGEPCSDDFASVAVVVAALGIVVPRPGRNHCACECKSMCGSR